MNRIVLVVALLLPLGCARVQPAPAQPIAPRPLTDAERLLSFDQLTAVEGGQSPSVTQAEVKVTGDDGTVRSVPVIRIVMSDRVFFDTGQDTPLPSSAPALDLIATNLLRDGTGIAVTVVGHTDAVGGDAYNLDLSRRRAAEVVASLAARRVPARQLSAVAMGKSQPTASNDTAEGRARNRRVEFLISTDFRANEAALRIAPAPPRPGRPTLNDPSGPVQPQSPAPAEVVVPRAPEAVNPAPLGAAKTY